MIKVLLEAPILTQSGYGEHSRLVFRALEKVRGIEVHTSPLNWGTTSWLTEFPSGLTPRIQKSIDNFRANLEHHKRNNKKLSYDVQIHVGILNEFQKRASYSVCVTAGIETDVVSVAWVKATWKGIDRVIVPSKHAKTGIRDTAYHVKKKNNTKQPIWKNPETSVHVVPYPVKNLSPVPLDFKLETDFNFLSIALLGPRKNLENMVKWFIEEFHDDSVGLILKAGISKGSTADRKGTLNFVSSLTSSYPDRKCKIYLLHGDLSEQEIQSLYVRDDIHAYINIAHGEGFGLPVFEASYNGMPVVATDWSGHLDFLSAPFREGNKSKVKKLFAKVDYEMVQVPESFLWKDVVAENSKWAEPKEKSYKRQIRNMYQQYGMYLKWAKALQKYNLEKYTDDKIMEQMRVAIFGEGYITKVITEEQKSWQRENSQIKVL